MSCPGGSRASVPPADLYCSIDKRRHPVLGGKIGTVLSEGAEEVADAVETAIDVIGAITRIDYAGLGGADIVRLPQLIGGVGGTCGRPIGWRGGV